MNFVVIGTDHTLQHREAGFEGLLGALVAQKYFEPLQAIAEEYHDKLNGSICQRLAEEHHLRWYNLDMTTEEKHQAGILQQQFGRPISSETVAYRIPSDTVREEAWVKKLINSGALTTLVVCGYLHFEPLVKKLREMRHSVDQRVYLETVPTIRLPLK